MPSGIAQPIQLRLLGVVDFGERDHVVDVDAGGALDKGVVVVGVPHPSGQGAVGPDGRGFDCFGNEDVVAGGAAVLVVGYSSRL